MNCFIKKIFENSADERVHRQFVRFGKGLYEKRAVLSLQKGKRIKLKGSFEYANDFVDFVSEFVGKFSGVILSKEQLDLEGGKEKNNVYIYEVSEIKSDKVMEIRDKIYFMLLDAETPEIRLKIKKRLPKPGKSGERKIDDKFCQLEADLKFWPKIKEAFFWDIPDCKKVRVEHSYEITELIMPPKEEVGDNFELIRLKAKRKGKIIRKLEIDGRESVKEKEFEV